MLDGQTSQAIRTEIETDPFGRGYAGKTLQETADLMCDGSFETGIQPCRFNAITVGIPFTPNIVTAQDIEEALSNG